MRFLVEGGKGVINEAEIQVGFVGWPKQILVLVFDKFIGNSWPSKEFTASPSICLYLEKLKLNSTDV